MSRRSSFAYRPVASVLHDPASVERLLDGLAADLDGAGGLRTRTADVDAPFAIVGMTGGTERYVLDATTARPDPRAPEGTRRTEPAARRICRSAGTAQAEERVTWPDRP